MIFGQIGDILVILPAFSVIPKKTFLGLDKQSAHCFTLKKSITNQFMTFFNLKRGTLQQEIQLVTEEAEFPATLRLIIQDKSKPNKLGIERNWKERMVLNIAWKGKDNTVKMMQKNLLVAINLVERGLKNNRQEVNFEHLGGNRFYVSIRRIELIPFNPTD